MGAYAKCLQQGKCAQIGACLGRQKHWVWTGTKGRNALRLMACLGGIKQHKSVVSYLVLNHNVPFNSAPPGELALDAKVRHRESYNRNTPGIIQPPLLTSILAGDEDFALFVLLLRPEADLELSRGVGTAYYNTL